MKLSEGLARDYLVARGYRDIAYEPDGNSPPDFVIERQIAVEVTQLDQLERSSSRSAYETGRPLIDRVCKVLRGIEGPEEGTRWLTLRYRRPLPPAEQVRRGTEAFAKQVVGGEAPIGAVHPIGENLELEYRLFTEGSGDPIRVGTVIDEDLGGFLAGELRRSLDSAIRKKSAKTARYRWRYEEWWLILIDFVSYGLPRSDQREQLLMPPLMHDWNRVVIVNPLDINQYLELDGLG